MPFHDPDTYPAAWRLSLVLFGLTAPFLAIVVVTRALGYEVAEPPYEIPIIVAGALVFGVVLGWRYGTAMRLGRRALMAAMYSLLVQLALLAELALMIWSQPERPPLPFEFPDVMMETLLQSLILDVARIALVNFFFLSALVFIFDYLGEKAGGWLAPSRERRRSGEKGEKTGDVIER